MNFLSLLTFLGGIFSIFPWLGTLRSSDIGISLPIFIIAECVLIYLDPESSCSIIGQASRTFSTAIFFLYEQVLYFSENPTSLPPLLCWLQFPASVPSLNAFPSMSIKVEENIEFTIYGLRQQIHPDDVFGQQMKEFRGETILLSYFHLL